jgi:Asp-tRNA(Asn)/Glu-tRNA(Gln) amidotransferase A subunit family amidase
LTTCGSSFAYTPLTNLCGIPGVSLPLGWQGNGLPLGLHFQAKQANDGLLLQLAAQIERALWWPLERWPRAGRACHPRLIARFT